MMMQFLAEAIWNVAIPGAIVALILAAVIDVAFRRARRKGVEVPYVFYPLTFLCSLSAFPIVLVAIASVVQVVES